MDFMIGGQQLTRDVSHVDIDISSVFQRSPRAAIESFFRRQPPVDWESTVPMIFPDGFPIVDTHPQEGFFIGAEKLDRRTGDRT